MELAAGEYASGSGREVSNTSCLDCRHSSAEFNHPVLNAPLVYSNVHYLMERVVSVLS